MEKREIMVSVICVTYNQSKYIEETLNSMINQITNFRYEIIIHDDCSTDGTVEIIKKYEDKYPDIIKPIFEEENQYSLGNEILDICFKKSRGKYIALCDGDDFWCDQNKLQKQFDFMESKEKCSLVTSEYKVLSEIDNRYYPIKNSYKQGTSYSTREIISGDGSLFCTNTMFFRSKYVRDLPSFYYNAPIKDFPLTIFLSLKGEVYCINDVMSVYRKNAIGSWSNNMSSGNYTIKQNKFFHQLKNMFDEIKTYTNHKFDKEIDMFLLRKELDILVNTQQYDIIKNNSNKFELLYKSGNLKDRIKHYLKVKNPSFYFKIKYKRK